MTVPEHTTASSTAPGCLDLEQKDVVKTTPSADRFRPFAPSRVPLRFVVILLHKAHGL